MSCYHSRSSMKTPPSSGQPGTSGASNESQTSRLTGTGGQTIVETNIDSARRQQSDTSLSTGSIGTSQSEQGSSTSIQDNQCRSWQIPQDSSEKRHSVVAKSSSQQNTEKDEKWKVKCSQKSIKRFKKVHAAVKKSKQQKISPSGKIESVKLGGKFIINALYRGNYPAEFSSLQTIFVCDQCFTYFSYEPTHVSHMKKCPYVSAPPGDEVYRDRNYGISVFEVHGAVDPMYCSNLCLLSMLWLEAKIVSEEVEPFVFYVLTIFSEGSFRPVGYFSRQKEFFTNNIACLCVFPCYQGKGYGTFLVDFSYLLSRLCGIPSGPERPLSAHGSLVYNKYWCDKLFHLIYTRTLQYGWENLDLGISDLVKETGIQEQDIFDAITSICSYEVASNNETIKIHINRESVMGIGEYIDEKFKSKLLAKEEFLDPSLKDRLCAQV